MSLNNTEIDRVIEMAWEDRTSFDAIENQFGITTTKFIYFIKKEI